MNHVVVLETDDSVQLNSVRRLKGKQMAAILPRFQIKTTIILKILCLFAQTTKNESSQRITHYKLQHED